MTTTTDHPPVTDRIEKRFEVRAPQARVWRALADATEFGTWFGMKIDSDFVPGRTAKGEITFSPNGLEPRTVIFELQVQKIEPEHYFSYRWHPYAVDPKIDYSAEPTTLVEFRLEPVADGTRVTIIESGFDQIPLARRAEAYRMDDKGWDGQMKRLSNHVA